MDISLIGNAFSMKHIADYHMEKEDYHVHHDYEILFPVFGSVSFHAEGRSYDLAPGNILIIPPGISHMYDKNNKNVYERVVLLLTDSFFRHLQQESGFVMEEGPSKEQLIQIGPSRFDKMYGILCELEAVLKSGDYADSPLGQAYLMQLLIFLNHDYLVLENRKKKEPDAFSRIGQIQQFIDRNLCDNLSLERIAEQCNISKYYLSHEFKKAFGISIHQYIRRKRLETARQFLQRGGSVSGAYIASGFTDYANFSKAFKKEFEVSPREFRKKVE